MFVLDLRSDSPLRNWAGDLLLRGIKPKKHTRKKHLRFFNNPYHIAKVDQLRIHFRRRDRLLDRSLEDLLRTSGSDVRSSTLDSCILGGTQTNCLAFSQMVAGLYRSRKIQLNRRQTADVPAFERIHDRHSLKIQNRKSTPFHEKSADGNLRVYEKVNSFKPTLDFSSNSLCFWVGRTEGL